MKLKFLGTGGGRYVTGEQKRKTAGIILKTEETQIHIDPGPGALVHTHKMTENPLETEAIIVSHAHLDHANDAEAITEMITQTGNKPGAIFANETTLKGYSDLEKKISNYHQNLCETVKTLEENTTHEYKDIKIESQTMFHGDPKTQGFTIKLQKEDKKIGFWTDTEYSEELLDLYQDVETLVIYCVRPKNEGHESHTALDDVVKIAEKTQPKNVIITHYGYSFLKKDLEKQKEWLKEKIEPKVIFAEDGMEFPGNRKLADF